MAKRISDAERVEQYFMTAEKDAAKLALDRATLILRTRGVMMQCDNAHGSLGVKYLAEPVQEVIPENQMDLEGSEE